MWADLAGDVAAEFGALADWSQDDAQEALERGRARLLAEARVRNRRCEERNREARNASKRAARAPAPRVYANALKTTCKAGHTYAGDNLVVWADGRRRCATCLAAKRAHKPRSNAS